MQIRIARNIGFCSGVRRAINIAESLLSKNKRIFSLGPLIHNPLVVKQLESKNLKVIHSLNNLSPHSHLVLPSHGTPQDILNIAKRKKLKIIDATCPNVYNVHKICVSLFKDGFRIIIIGDKGHPEIKTLVSLAPKSLVINSKKDIKNIKPSSKIGIISQTTLDKNKFTEIVITLLKNNIWLKELRIFNTICSDTSRRQSELRDLAKRVEAVFVIGSKSSANTKRLYCISRRINRNTYLIQTPNDFKQKMLENKSCVGIISGASTPMWLVKDVIGKIKGGN